MNNSPKISIVIPYYNPNQDYFKEAIFSILAQSYNNWETIIVNDSSSSESRIFLENFISSLNDKRFIIHHLDKNSGTSVAKNRGIELSKGEIVTFLDTDDIHLPWYYKDIINQFENQRNISIIASLNLYYINLDNTKNICFPSYYETLLKKEHSVLNTSTLNRELLEPEKDELLKLNNTLKIRLTLSCTPRLAIKKEVLDLLNFDPELHTGEDCDLCLQILNNKELTEKVLIMQGSGYLYRFYYSDTRLTQKEDLIVESNKKLITKHNNPNSLSYKIIKDWKENNGELLFWQQSKDEEEYYKKMAQWQRKKRAPFIIRLKNLITNPKRLKDKLANSFIRKNKGGEAIKKMLSKKRFLNKLDKVKNRFDTFLNECKDNETTKHATKVYDAIFN